jgi:hypothetical protein
MMACVTEAKGRLTDTVYALQFDIEVTESGEAGHVKLRDSYPSERALEACLGQALEGMTLPVSVLRLLPKQKAVSPASRGLMGQGAEELLLLGAGTSLGPIFLTAAGVTVIVAASVYVTAEAIDAVRRLRKRREKCRDMFVTCQNERPWSCSRLIQGQTTLCEICRDKCQFNQRYEQYSGECYQCGFHDLP